MSDGDTWDQSRKLVFSQLERHEGNDEKLATAIETESVKLWKVITQQSADIKDLVEKITSLREKMKLIWGGLALAIGAAAALVVNLLS